MRRSISTLLALVLAFIMSTLLTHTSGDVLYSQSYPTVVCPPTLSGLSSQISIASKKTAFQRLNNRGTKTSEFKILRSFIKKDSLVVTANGVTPVIWQSRIGSWAGGTICSGPASSQWFVGGSSDVTSRGHLVLINSGLSDAVVDVQAFSEKGKRALTSFNIKAKSFRTISLDSLATGDKNLVVHVVSHLGRINAFLIDELGTGLKSMGGDFVNPVPSAKTNVVIPAIPIQISKKGQKAAMPHTLRIMNTSNVVANFTLQVFSADGSFIPVGFDSRSISPGVVTSLKLAPNIATSAFAVRIKSDEPVVAAISSTVTTSGCKDLVWSTAAQPLVPMAMAITGLSPVLTFTSDSIAVRIQVNFVNGKKKEVSIKGSDIATWHVPSAARSITIIKTNANTYAGALIASDNGFGYIPITPGSLLTRVEIPRSNIRILNP